MADFLNRSSKTLDNPAKGNVIYGLKPETEKDISGK